MSSVRFVTYVIGLYLFDPVRVDGVWGIPIPRIPLRFIRGYHCLSPAGLFIDRDRSFHLKSPIDNWQSAIENRESGAGISQVGDENKYFFCFGSLFL